MENDARRFPLPWTINGNDSCFWVEDAEGKRFGYTYFRIGEAGIGSSYGHQLSRAEAWRIACIILKLPRLLQS